MKHNELKKILKPLIKQCIKEVIFEEGVLSGLISEVVQGLGGRQILTEGRSESPTRQPQHESAEYSSAAIDPELANSLEDRKRKLEESMGSQFAGILDNTAPLSKGGSLGGGGNAQSPLSSFEPNDPGVDISGLMALGGGKNWKHMI